MNHNEIKARLLQAENVEEVIAIAKETGLELSANEATRIFESLQQFKAAESKGNQLDESELEAVAGGKGCSICKGSVKNQGIGFSGDKITILWNPEWCWSGADYCKFWTETYDNIKIY